MNANAKEFYPENHVAMPKAEINMTEGKQRRAKGTRWVKKVEPNDTITTAPVIIDKGKGVGPIDDDGDAGQIPPHDGDAGIPPVIDIGDAEVPVDDDAPLEDDGKRDLKADR